MTARIGRPLHSGRLLPAPDDAAENDPFPQAPFQTWCADPPWLERGAGQSKRGADRHYPLMRTSQIADTLHHVLRGAPVAYRSHGWLWVTDNFLEDGLKVLRASEYRPIRTLVWVKLKQKAPRGWARAIASAVAGADPLELAAVIADLIRWGLGQYARGSHELAILGVRGPAMVPEPAARPSSVVLAPIGRHSAKPAAAYRAMASISPGPRLEIFARDSRPGWAAWGNEV